MIVSEPEKTEWLIEVFRLSNLAPFQAEARRIYEDHVTAKAAVRMALATKCSRELLREAERNAAMHRARWRRCREKIIVMKWEPTDK